MSVKRFFSYLGLALFCAAMVFALFYLYVHVKFRRSYYSTSSNIASIWDEGFTEEQKSLVFLYKHKVGKLVRRLCNKKWMSTMMGWYNNSRISARKVKPFVKKHNIDMEQFVVPPGGYRSFNDFFTRKLKPRSRSIDKGKREVISPVDGKLLVFPRITKELRFYVKSHEFDIGGFLQSEELEQKFRNGVMMVFRLAPKDYHRYHFPFDCVPSDVREIGGGYDSVRPVVYQAGYQPLMTNKRRVTMLRKGICGETALVAVGAMGVGRMVEVYHPESEAKKGDEIGYFEFGGSTIVLVFQAGKIKPLANVVVRSQQGVETPVKMGEAVAKIVT
jgi:phosphatidylserine decarboxylase